MKKLLLPLVALMLSFGFANAQTAQTTQPAKTEHTKKDGTPDKRYKENKDGAKAEHAKKDAPAKTDKKAAAPTK